MNIHTELKIKELELQIQKLKVKTDHLKNPPIKEKTEAEKWAGINCSVSEPFENYGIRAHNAGQEHATAATHEKYKELIDAVEKFVNHMDCAPCDYITDNIRLQLEKINKDN